MRRAGPRPWLDLYQRVQVAVGSGLLCCRCQQHLHGADMTVVNGLQVGCQRAGGGRSGVSASNGYRARGARRCGAGTKPVAAARWSAGSRVPGCFEPRCVCWASQPAPNGREEIGGFASSPAARCNFPAQELPESVFSPNHMALFCISELYMLPRAYFALVSLAVKLPVLM